MPHLFKVLTHVVDIATHHPSRMANITLSRERRDDINGAKSNGTSYLCCIQTDIGHSILDWQSESRRRLAEELESAPIFSTMDLALYWWWILLQMGWAIGSCQ